MSNKLTKNHSASIFARLASSLRKLGRDSRGVEMVEVLVVIVVFALGGIAAMKTLSGQVNTSAGKVEKKVSSSLGL